MNEPQIIEGFATGIFYSTHARDNNQETLLPIIRIYRASKLLLTFEKCRSSGTIMCLERITTKVIIHSVNFDS